jgi:hypothetical protein
MQKKSLSYDYYCYFDRSDIPATNEPHRRARLEVTVWYYIYTIA